MASGLSHRRIWPPTCSKLSITKCHYPEKTTSRKVNIFGLTATEQTRHKLGSSIARKKHRISVAEDASATLAFDDRTSTSRYITLRHLLPLYQSFQRSLGAAPDSSEASMEYIGTYGQDTRAKTTSIDASMPRHRQATVMRRQGNIASTLYQRQSYYEKPRRTSGRAMRLKV